MSDIPALLGHVAALTDERDDYKRGMALVEHLHHERCGERDAAVAKLAAVEAASLLVGRAGRVEQSLRRMIDEDEPGLSIGELLRRVEAALYRELEGKVEALRERDAALAALLQHVRYYGGGPHHPDDCPGNCEACDVNAAVSAVLAQGGGDRG
jgi:hypothetical protein